MKNQNFSPAQHTRLECLEPRLAPAGVVTVTTAGSVLNITGDGSDNSILVTEVADGQWRIHGPGTSFKLGAAGAEVAELFVNARSSIKAVLNGGADSLELVEITLPGTLNVAGNAGNDQITLKSVTLNGAVTLDGGTEADTVNISINSSINQTLTVKMGAGDDVVRLGDGTYRNVNVDMGTGVEEFNLAGRVHVFGSLTASTAGTGSFFLRTESLVVTGALALKSLAGTNVVEVNSVNAGSQTFIGGAFSITTGAGTDIFKLRGAITVGGAFTLKAGNGLNQVQSQALDVGAPLTELAVGSISYTGGTGEDFWDLFSTSVKVGAAAMFTLGAGTNEVTFTGTTLRIGGGLTYVGDAGEDEMNLDVNYLEIGGPVSFKGGNGANQLDIYPVYGRIGSVSYVGGTGIDQAWIGDIEGSTTRLVIGGNVSATLGAGQSEFSLRDLAVYGTVTGTSATVAGTAERFEITESTILGTVSLKGTSTASTIIEVEDSIFQGAVTLDSGAGADIVRLDNKVASARLSTYYGAVKVILGTGDDQLFAGRNPAVANTGNAFLSTLIVDGGAGADSADYITGYGNTFLIPVVAAGRPGVETFT